jgi:hypothetical protein
MFRPLLSKLTAAHALCRRFDAREITTPAARNTAVGWLFREKLRKLSEILERQCDQTPDT